MFKNIYVNTNTYMTAITIDENGSHEVEGELGGFGRRNVITMSKIEKNIVDEV